MSHLLRILVEAAFVVGLLVSRSNKTNNLECRFEPPCRLDHRQMTKKCLRIGRRSLSFPFLTGEAQDGIGLSGNNSSKDADDGWMRSADQAHLVDFATPAEGTGRINFNRPSNTPLASTTEL
ncbi:uncharacterized protein FOMMEDRAFT_18295 [Fomitiporia mediterranea MF3/22]|uniref:uncharacterized protein n=1 Tax=Fomitiporia mediterranea (strain MF3/22) TaxID=694068 RepID=UPI0004408170|nr:uncharacterized protein FOMMEDRAFT_18295 [Fomitiporia mediterranea MF3/22]EJD06092.1 hypothetical protein FOMMEDRAFT_18295 [Fomitiporia mediterranea MF3/22]